MPTNTPKIIKKQKNYNGIRTINEYPTSLYSYRHIDFSGEDVVWEVVEKAVRSEPFSVALFTLATKTRHRTKFDPNIPKMANFGLNERKQDGHRQTQNHFLNRCN